MCDVYSKPNKRSYTVTVKFIRMQTYKGIVHLKVPRYGHDKERLSTTANVSDDSSHNLHFKASQCPASLELSYV